MIPPVGIPCPFLLRSGPRPRQDAGGQLLPAAARCKWSHRDIRRRCYSSRPVVGMQARAEPERWAERRGSAEDRPGAGTGILGPWEAAWRFPNAGGCLSQRCSLWRFAAGLGGLVPRAQAQAADQDRHRHRPDRGAGRRREGGVGRAAHVGRGRQRTRRAARSQGRAHRLRRPVESFGHTQHLREAPRHRQGRPADRAVRHRAHCADHAAREAAQPAADGQLLRFR